MPAAAPNKHRIRSEATQTAVLKAAERVFLRLGFEAAQMTAIAREAGRTTGALYAHFAGKEELFLAVLSRRMSLTRRRGRRHADRYLIEHPGDLLGAIRSFYITLYEPGWAILKSEFKLYLLRRPRQTAALRRRFELLDLETDFRSAFSGHLENALSRMADRSRALEAFVAAIVLEMYFDPKQMSLAKARAILGDVFDGVTGRLVRQEGPVVPGHCS